MTFYSHQRKIFLKKNANYVTLVLNKLHVNVPTVLLCFASVPKIKSIQIRKLLSFVQSIASWFVFPPNSSWAGNSTLLQYTKTLIGFTQSIEIDILPSTPHSDTLAPFIKEKTNPISATNEDPDWIGLHRCVRFR